MSKISFIIQGPTSRTLKSKFKPNFLNFFKDLKNYGEVIISTYKNEPLEEFQDWADQIVLATPFYRHKPNFYFSIYNQFESCLNGALLAKNDFCIKFRTDEFYSNIKHIIEKLDKNKLMCSNIHYINPEYRKIHNYTEKFRTSDHFFGTAIEAFRQTMQEALDAIGYRDFRVQKFQQHIQDNNIHLDKEKYEYLFETNIVQSPEGVLFKSYMHSQNISFKDRTYFNVMRDNLSVVDIGKCAPYIWGMGGVHYTKKETLNELFLNNLPQNLKEFNLAEDNIYSKEWVTEEFINENLHTR